MGDQIPNWLTSGLDWASGNGGLPGSPTPPQDLIVQTPDGSGIFLEEMPDSPDIERAEQATFTHSFEADWDTAMIALITLGRGRILSDTNGNQTYVLSNRVTRAKGNRAIIRMTAEGINFDVPPEEYEVQPIEFNPPIWYHPRYSTVRTYNLDADGNQINPALYTGFQIILALQQAATLPQHESREENVNNLTPSTVADPLVLGLVDELLQKLRKGESEFYLCGWRVIYSKYFWMSPMLDPGGYLCDPVRNNILPYYFWSQHRDDPQSDPVTDNTLLALAQFINPDMYRDGLSWLRMCDQVNYQRTWFRVTASFVGAPLGAWDADLYPNPLGDPVS